MLHSGLRRCDQEIATGGFRHTLQRRKPTTQVLIVDDDYLSATPLQAVFHYLGCEAHWAPAQAERVLQIMKYPADLLVMDWSSKCPHVMMAVQSWIHENFGFHHDEKNKIAVVTTSSTERLDMAWPFCEHFEPIARWRKSMEVARLLPLAAQALVYIKKSG